MPTLRDLLHNHHVAALDAARPTFEWRELAQTRTSAPWAVAAPSSCTPAAPCGVAVDLGTTHLRLGHWNGSAGRQLRCWPPR